MYICIGLTRGEGLPLYPLPAHPASCLRLTNIVKREKLTSCHGQRPVFFWFFFGVELRPQGFVPKREGLPLYPPAHPSPAAVSQTSPSERSSTSFPGQRPVFFFFGKGLRLQGFVPNGEGLPLYRPPPASGLQTSPSARILISCPSQRPVLCFISGWGLGLEGSCLRSKGYPYTAPRQMSKDQQVTRMELDARFRVRFLGIYIIVNERAFSYSR